MRSSIRPLCARFRLGGGGTGVALAASVLAGACLPMGGCYERVVRARGPGAERIEVSEPYQENYPIDDWLFGKQEPSKRP